MSEPAQPPGTVARRQFLAGMGAAAVAIPASRSIAGKASGTSTGAHPAAGPTTESPFPAVPTATTTTNQDRLQMLWQLGMTEPTLPPRATDPNRPPNVRPSDPNNLEGNWTDPLGHFVTRAAFGQWITYDSDAGPA